jgi:hypothetical protein
LRNSFTPFGTILTEKNNSVTHSQARPSPPHLGKLGFLPANLSLVSFDPTLRIHRLVYHKTSYAMAEANHHPAEPRGDALGTGTENGADGNTPQGRPS